MDEMKFLIATLELPHPQTLAGSPPTGGDAVETAPSSWREFLLEPGGQDYVGINSYDGLHKTGGRIYAESIQQT